MTKLKRFTLSSGVGKAHQVLLSLHLLVFFYAFHQDKLPIFCTYNSFFRLDRNLQFFDRLF